MSPAGCGCLGGSPSWWTRVRAAAARTAWSRSWVVAQAGGVLPGPVDPSRRMTAWKWTWPRFWYSATFA